LGLSLEFYAGDAESIGADFAAVDFDGLRDGTRARAYADFSLHLSPTDLDLLGDVLAERLGVTPLALSDCLLRTVGRFDGEGGAQLVDPEWVELVAAADESAVPDLTAVWIGKVGEQYGEPLTVTPDSVRAVASLIRLCRLAVRDGLDVVHAWYL
jgi:hypothetical protein